jgi:cellulose synthase/poly-beta-1,6-N-acetylglucosamine synthase-like glycosyltransferase
MTGKGAAPALSVIVPSYGRSELLGGLLARLGAQTLAPERFEVVAVDDGSPDDVGLALCRSQGKLPLRTLSDLDSPRLPPWNSVHADAGGASSSATERVRPTTPCWPPWA